MLDFKIWDGYRTLKLLYPFGRWELLNGPGLLARNMAVLWSPKHQRFQLTILVLIIQCWAHWMSEERLIIVLLENYHEASSFPLLEKLHCQTGAS